MNTDQVRFLHFKCAHGPITVGYTLAPDRATAEMSVHVFGKTQFNKRIGRLITSGRLRSNKSVTAHIIDTDTPEVSVMATAIDFVTARKWGPSCRK